ncbi:MAG: hypothetical protein K8R36_09970 [Planctomycetales bacterium]|nr:hypothetical protein [Planctomycetales bacterium]
MATTLNWRVSSSASALHAADALVRGEALVDAGLASVLFEPAAGLQAEIQSAQLPEERFWRNLLGVSATIESNRELARLALVKTIGRGTAAENAEPRIAAAVTAVEGAFARHLPKLAEELPLRMGPLREQWEARGPGWLPRVAQLAMLPVALAAGREVELCLDSPDLLAQAITNWRLIADPTVVTQWWETYRESRPPFAVALAALDKMLA